MAQRGAVGQLSLAIDPGGSRPRLPARFQPMRPSPGTAPFDDPGYFFEPWWPGTRMLVEVDDRRLRLETDHLTDPLRTFPELDVLRDHIVGSGVLVDGTLLVLDDTGRPDAELLRSRLARPEARRGHAAFVASDLVYAASVPLASIPFEQRRARLADVVRDGDWCVLSRGLKGEGVTLAAAVASLGLAEVSARLLSGQYRPGRATDEWLRLPVAETPAAETRPLLTLLQRLPL